MSSCPGNQIKIRRMSDISLKEVLGNIIKNISSGGKINREDILNAWQDSLGNEMGKNSAPVKLKNGILTVNVINSVLLYELTLRKRELIGKMQKAFNSHSIKDIRFRIGDIKEKR